MNGTDEESIVAEGDWGTVRYAVESSGDMPAKEFVEGLDPPKLRKMANLFQWMANLGRISNDRRFKQVSDKIFEFKNHQIRIACFRVGQVWFLAHGFVKKQDKWPPKELTRANRIRNEHLARQ